MRKLPVFITLLFLTQMAWAAKETLVAANYSDRYHRSTCKVVNKIDPQDLVTYTTPEDAWKAGLRPCKKCNPPVPEGAEYETRGFNFGPRNENDPDL